MDEINKVLKEISAFDKEPIPTNVIEELETQRNEEMEEDAQESNVINSVLVDAGINPYAREEDYDENESYYEQL